MKYCQMKRRGKGTTCSAMKDSLAPRPSGKKVRPAMVDSSLLSMTIFSATSLAKSLEVKSFTLIKESSTEDNLIKAINITTSSASTTFLKRYAYGNKREFYQEMTSL